MSEKQAKKKRQEVRQKAEKPRKPGLKILDVDVTEWADRGYDEVKLVTDLPSPDPEHAEDKVVFVMTMPLKTGADYVREHMGVKLHPKPMKMVEQDMAAEKKKPLGPKLGLPL